MALIKINSLTNTDGIPSSFSVPWPRGVFNSENSIEYSFDKKWFKPLDTHVLALWEDGSVKWTSHTLEANQDFFIKKAEKKEVKDSFNITESVSELKITNKLGTTTTFDKNGLKFINSIINGDTKIVCNGGEIVGSTCLSTEMAGESLSAKTSKVKIERKTCDKVVVLTSGTLISSFFPDSGIDFHIRSYIFPDTDYIKFTVSIVYRLSKNEKLKSIGLQLSNNFGSTPLFDRHIKLTSSNGGVMSESCQSITGLWHAAPPSLRAMQAKGEQLPDLTDPAWQWDTDGLKYVPSFDQYSLAQLTSHGFEISKKFCDGFSKVKVIGGGRNDGSVFVGSPQTGGLSVGVAKFWEKYPSELQVTGLTQKSTNINVWFYSPSAQPLETTPYYDGLGADNYTKQIEGLYVTYEDYEPGFNDSTGIGRSFEVFMKPTVGMVSSEEFKEFSLLVREPPVLVADLAYISLCKVFPFWSPDHSISQRKASAKEKEIESNLDQLFDYYCSHIELNDWYGFWDYGDVMHTPDAYRHQWRYDVGGYAWDNSELSTDLWLWMYFLHTGRLDVFRVAEAMTRHTGEVDVYHAGRFQRFGTRHGVQHWSDSSKQLRISNVLFRRFFYYLSGGDERVGQLMNELNDSQQAMLTLDSHRKVQEHPSKLEENYAMANIGLDWGSLLGAWMTHWERREPGWESAKSKILNSVRGLVALPHGFANNAVLMNVKTGECKAVPPPTPEWAISHLSTVFGLNESITELIEIMENFDKPLSQKLIKFWTDYAVCFNGGPKLQVEKFGFEFPKVNISLQQSHARCTAHVAWLFQDTSLEKAAWEQFFHTDGFSDEKVDWSFKDVAKYDSVTGAESELPFVTTNIVAQYGISAIYLLSKAGNSI